VASGGPGLVKTSGYTITVADILGGNKFLYNSASPGTFTLPTSSLVDGMVVNVAQIGSAALTVSGGTIVGTTATTAQYQGLSFVYVASGTTWYSIAPNATAPGLAIVTPTSIANSGGSASASGGAVTFTGVSSISLNGVFSATYENYRIVFTSTSGSTIQTSFRLRAAGSDNSSSYFYNLIEAGGGVSNSPATGATSARTGYAATTVSFNSFDVSQPFLSVVTNYAGNYLTQVGNYTGLCAGGHNNAASYDGITFLPASSTLTGTVRVYGYKNS
jgi:hypothetical protein